MNVVGSMIPMMVHLGPTRSGFPRPITMLLARVHLIHSKTQNERKGSEKEATRRIS